MRVSNQCYALPVSYINRLNERDRSLKTLAKWLSTLLFEIDKRADPKNPLSVTTYKDTHIDKITILNRLKAYEHQRALIKSLSSLRRLYFTLEPSLKTAVVGKLQEGFDECMEGFHDRADSLLQAFYSTRTLTEHLAKIRINLVNRAAAQVTDEVHAQRMFGVVAARNNLGIIPVNPTDGFVGRIPVTQIVAILQDTFNHHFRPWIIMVQLLDSLRQQLIEWGGYENNEKQTGYTAEEIMQLQLLLAEFFELADPSYFNVYDFFIVREKMPKDPDAPLEFNAVELNWPRIHGELLRKFMQPGYLTMSLSEQTVLEQLVTRSSNPMWDLNLAEVASLITTEHELQPAFYVLNMISPLEAWIILAMKHQNSMDAVFNEPSSNTTLSEIISSVLKSHRSPEEINAFKTQCLIPLINHALFDLGNHAAIILSVIQSLPREYYHEALCELVGSYSPETYHIIFMERMLFANIEKHKDVFLFYLDALLHIPDEIIRNELIKKTCLTLSQANNNVLMHGIMHSLSHLDRLIHVIQAINNAAERDQLIATMLTQRNNDSFNALDISYRMIWKEKKNISVVFKLLDLIENENLRIETFNSIVFSHLNNSHALYRSITSDTSALHYFFEAIFRISDEAVRYRYIEQMFFSKVIFIKTPSELRLVIVAAQDYKCALEIYLKALYRIVNQQLQRELLIKMLDLKFREKNILSIAAAANSTNAIQLLKAFSLFHVRAEREHYLSMLLDKPSDLFRLSIKNSLELSLELVKTVMDIENPAIKENLVSAIFSNNEPEPTSLLIYAIKTRPQIVPKLLLLFTCISDKQQRIDMIKGEMTDHRDPLITAIHHSARFAPQLIPMLLNCIEYTSQVNDVDELLEEYLAPSCNLSHNVLNHALNSGNSKAVGIVFEALRQWINHATRVRVFGKLIGVDSKIQELLFMKALNCNAHALILSELKYYFNEQDIEQYLFNVFSSGFSLIKALKSTHKATSFPFIMNSMMKHGQKDAIRYILTHNDYDCACDVIIFLLTQNTAVITSIFAQINQALNEEEHIEFLYKGFNKLSWHPNNNLTQAIIEQPQSVCLLFDKILWVYSQKQALLADLCMELRVPGALALGSPAFKETILRQVLVSVIENGAPGEIIPRLQKELFPNEHGETFLFDFITELNDALTRLVSLQTALSILVIYDESSSISQRANQILLNQLNEFIEKLIKWQIESLPKSLVCQPIPVSFSELLSSITENIRELPRAITIRWCCLFPRRVAQPVNDLDGIIQQLNTNTQNYQLWAQRHQDEIVSQPHTMNPPVMEPVSPDLTDMPRKASPRLPTLFSKSFTYPSNRTSEAGPAENNVGGNDLS